MPTRSGLICIASFAALLSATLCAPDLAQTDPQADPLINRKRENRQRAIEQFGGTRQTERAVADGLAWLAAHQRPDGIWDRKGFDQLCPADDRCSQVAMDELNRDADVGVSALAALAFLGAGHTHERGPYAEHLSRVFSYLLAQQRPDGSFSDDWKFGTYGNAIATLAIAEASILTKDPVLNEPLRRAVAFLVRCQQDGGGWDNTGDTSTNRNDTTVTSWVLMALKSADAAGVRIPVKTRFHILRHFDEATFPDGRVWYADRTRGAGSREPRFLEPGARRHGPGITATGLYARSALGLRLDDTMAKRQIGLLIDALPNLNELSRPDTNAWYNEYYWYYGTLAMFHVGGEPWQQWNNALRRTILEHQERPVTRKGRHKHAYGSWSAFGKEWGDWCRSGGRIYATAINTLSLEIYYRYVPAYLAPGGLLGSIEVREYIDSLLPAELGDGVKLAQRLHPDTGEPILLELCGSRNRSARIDAAVALSALGSPMGRELLAAEKDRADEAGRRAIDEALRSIQNRPAPTGEYGPIEAVNSQARMILFRTGEMFVYYGQRVRIRRDGRTIGTAVVNRRFSPQKSAAARIESENVAFKTGDMVMALDDQRTEQSGD